MQQAIIIFRAISVDASNSLWAIDEEGSLVKHVVSPFSSRRDLESNQKLIPFYVGVRLHDIDGFLYYGK